MPEVKIVRVVEGFYDSYGDDAYHTIRSSITDWETISEDDLQLLQANMYRLQQHYGGSDYLRLVVKDTLPVVERLSSIREWIAEERAKEQEAKAKRQAATVERERKRMLKKAQTEQRLLEELKKKYPEQAVDIQN